MSGKLLFVRRAVSRSDVPSLLHHHQHPFSLSPSYLPTCLAYLLPFQPSFLPFLSPTLSRLQYLLSIQPFFPSLFPSPLFYFIAPSFLPSFCLAPFPSAFSLSLLPFLLSSLLLFPSSLIPALLFLFLLTVSCLLLPYFPFVLNSIFFFSQRTIRISCQVIEIQMVKRRHLLT